MFLACGNDKPQWDKNVKILKTMFPECEIWGLDIKGEYNHYYIVCKDTVIYHSCGSNGRLSWYRVLNKK